MAFKIGQDSRESGASRNEKPDSHFPEHTHTKHQPHGKAADSSDHRVLSSEAVGAGHLEGMDRLNDFGGFPDMEPFGSGPGSDEGIDGQGHVIGKRSPFSER